MQRGNGLLCIFIHIQLYNTNLYSKGAWKGDIVNRDRGSPERGRVSALVRKRFDLLPTEFQISSLETDRVHDLEGGLVELAAEKMSANGLEVVTGLDSAEEGVVSVSLIGLDSRKLERLGILLLHDEDRETVVRTTLLGNRG